MPSVDSNNADPSPADKPTLRFFAGQYEGSVIALITVVQLSFGAIALFTFAFWFLASPSASGDWNLDILASALGIGAVVYLLHQLYE